MESLLEGPAYTKPAEWRGHSVPEILTSGNHGAIARWRREQAFARTATHRPELLDRIDPAALDKKDRAALALLGWRAEGDRLVREAQVEDKNRDGNGGGDVPGDDFADQPPA
jgi:tRNA (guanine37-N1)-methyltransferase